MTDTPDQTPAFSFYYSFRYEQLVDEAERWRDAGYPRIALRCFQMAVCCDPDTNRSWMERAVR